MNTKKIILASSSPRRIAIMKAQGIHPVIMPADINETLPFEMDMCTAPMYLALKKSMAVEAQLINDEVSSIIIAADTIVYDNEIIGKPKDDTDALSILKRLRSGMHHVVTGVAIIKSKTLERKVFCETTKVFFKDYSDQMLNDYVKTREPYDKAGGYAIQGTFGKYVDHIEGDYDNVIGFPWKRICKEMKQFSQSHSIL